MMWLQRNIWFLKKPKSTSNLYVSYHQNDGFTTARSLIVLLIASLAFWRLCEPILLKANPTAPVVAGGGATVTGLGTSTVTINQTTGRAVINWGSFSINTGELTNFLQPSATSAILNRVTSIGSNYQSIINGTLQGNGQVFLLNPNGILVGKTGMINTQTFGASTLSLGNDAFLQSKGSLRFVDDGKGGAAAIVNQGTINANGGDIYLISQRIDNQGKLNASKGTVGLGAGSEVLLQQASGDEHIFVKSQSASGSPKGRSAAISNSGRIAAANAELQAAGGNMYALAINNSGVIRATGISKRDGHVYLGGGGGKVLIKGNIAATEGRHGGKIRITGKQIQVASSARIEAQGKKGGGQINIGGGARGQDPNIQNAKTLLVNEGAVIDASALQNGDGGHVVLWSNDHTHFEGLINAKGGAEGGNGGLVEVSGHQQLDFLGKVDTLAPHGKTGSLLLDPVNLLISDTEATSNSTNTDGTYSGSTEQGSNDQPQSVIALNDLQTALQTSDITVSTSGTGSDEGNITLSLSTSPTLDLSGHILTLNADKNITFTGDLTTSTNPGDKLVLTAGPENGGNIYLTGNLTTGALEMQAGGSIQQAVEGSEDSPTGVLQADTVNIVGAAKVKLNADNQINTISGTATDSIEVKNTKDIDVMDLSTTNETEGLIKIIDSGNAINLKGTLSSAMVKLEGSTIAESDNGTITTPDLELTSTDSVTLDATNNIDKVYGTVANTLSLTNDKDLEIGKLTSNDSTFTFNVNGNINISDEVSVDNLQLSAQGDIAEIGNGAITRGNVTINSANNVDLSGLNNAIAEIAGTLNESLTIKNTVPLAVGNLVSNDETNSTFTFDVQGAVTQEPGTTTSAANLVAGSTDTTLELTNSNPNATSSNDGDGNAEQKEETANTKDDIEGIEGNVLGDADSGAVSESSDSTSEGSTDSESGGSEEEESADSGSADESADSDSSSSDESADSDSSSSDESADSDSSSSDESADSDSSSSDESADSDSSSSDESADSDSSSSDESADSDSSSSDESADSDSGGGDESADSDSDSGGSDQDTASEDESINAAEQGANIESANNNPVTSMDPMKGNDSVNQVQGMIGGPSSDNPEAIRGAFTQMPSTKKKTVVSNRSRLGGAKRLSEYHRPVPTEGTGTDPDTYRDVTVVVIVVMVAAQIGMAQAAMRVD